MVESLQRAWQLVRDQLRNHGEDDCSPDYLATVHDFIYYQLLVREVMNTFNSHSYLARLRIEEKHLLPAITDDTPLEYLIPTTTGAGACTTALVDFLVLTHCDFIEKCRGIIKGRAKGYE